MNIIGLPFFFPGSSVVYFTLHAQPTPNGEGGKIQTLQKQANSTFFLLHTLFLSPLPPFSLDLTYPT